ncbi:MAG TPA: XRE family transcriptional regulator, partial [Candidatus Choladocola avistercoris]|nr:XRE family transcriptional regulator [Candidatus Choladocola avistercoris]
RMPSYDILIKLSRIFHVTTDYLLGLEIKHEIDVSGLTEAEVLAIANLIKAMQQRG